MPGASIQYSEEIKVAVAQGLKPVINLSTLVIIINNLLVGASLYISSRLIFNLNKNNSLDQSGIRLLKKLAITFYIVYFVILGVRVGISIKGSTYNSYWFSLLTLIMPHGLLEVTGFALVSATSLSYYTEKLSKTEFLRLIKVAATIIIIAGIVETTLTPFVFSKFALIT